MALARPPALPGGGVFSVNTVSDRPAKPFQSSVPRMMTSQVAPNAVAAHESTMMIELRRRRRP